MQSIHSNNNTLKGATRPPLTVNTNIRRKKWGSLFSSRDRISPITGPNSTKIIRSFTDEPTSDVRKSVDDKLDALSIDSDSVHSNSSVHSVLKKFHMPHFHLRSHSQHSSPAAYKEAAAEFIPVAPEPIMPDLVNWSPEAPLSPPPWELQNKTQFNNVRNKRHSLGYQYASMTTFERYEEEDDSITTIDSSNTTEYHSDSEISSGRLSSNKSLKRLSNTSTPSSSLSRSSTLVSSTLVGDSFSRIRRRSSCPSYDRFSMSSSGSTVVENDIIAITEQHTRTSVLKKYTHPADKKSPFKSCQKAKARAFEAATNGNTVQPGGNPLISSFCEDSLKYLYIPNVFDPVTREPVLEFSTVKPRKYQLHRKTSWKREAKALMTWHHTLEEYLRKPTPPMQDVIIPAEKKERYNLTRKFILREIYVTEVNFWNHLYYSKVIFYDALCNALERGSEFVKESDADPFANLFDLMQFSAKLINRLRHFQLGQPKPIENPMLASADVCPNVDCNNLHLGKAIREMAQDFVVFLRCALDYKDNRKMLENSLNNKGYLLYRQKLGAQKKTSQFQMNDYLIIPIQRVARYGLLIADLIKHTEPTHPDYNDLVIAHKIVSSLTFAMDSVQKKKKKA